MKKVVGICLVVCVVLCGCGMTRSIVEQGSRDKNSLKEEQSNEDWETDSKVKDKEDSWNESVVEELEQEGSSGDLSEIIYTGSLDVYSISQETLIRSGEKVGDLSKLTEDEYFSQVLHVQYNGEGTLSWSEAYVTVDGGEPWYWSGGSLESGQSTSFHIFM